MSKTAASSRTRRPKPTPTQTADAVALKARAFDAALTELEAARVGAADAETAFDGLAADAGDDVRHEALLALGEAETRLLLAANAMDALAADNALTNVGKDDAPAAAEPERDYLTRAIEGAVLEARRIRERDGVDAALAFVAALRTGAAETISLTQGYDAALAAEQLALTQTVQVWAVGDVLFNGALVPPGQDFWVDPKTRATLGTTVADEAPQAADLIENEQASAQSS